MADISKIKVNGTEYNVADDTAREGLEAVYTKTETDTLLSTKADKTEIPTDFYTTAEVDEALSEKADADSIPTALSQLDEDDTHKVVTADEITAWNGKSDFDGDYNSLTNRPTIPTVPTNVSAFTNDAGYLTEQSLSGYATEEWVEGKGYLTLGTLPIYEGAVE